MTVIRPNSVAGINSITVQSGNSLAVHKANGELIRTITSNTGVSTFSSVSVGTATTDNSAAKSINIGLGASIAQHDVNTLTFGTNGDPRITIDASGNFNVGSAATIKAGGNATFSGIVTAASFVGDGSGLTGAGPSLTGSTNNTIVTVTGANAIQGESNLTFDGSALAYSAGGAERFNLAHTSGGIVALKNPSNSSMQFGTNDITRMTITSDGKIGIGTDSPSFEFTVADMSGAAVIRAKDGANDKIVDLIANSTGGLLRTIGSYPLVLNTNQTERMRISSAGLVGINTDSPQAKLQVNDSNPVIAEFYRVNGGTNDQARISLGAKIGNIPSQRGVNLIAENNGAGHDFIVACSSSHAAGPSEKLRITSADQVLIGTASAFTSVSYRRFQIGTADGGWINLARTGTPSSGNHVGAIHAFTKSPDGNYHDTIGFDFKAAASASNTSKPTRMEFFTTPVDATTKEEVMRISEIGQVCIGNSTQNAAPFTTTTIFNVQRSNNNVASMYHVGTNNNPVLIVRHQRAGSSGNTAVQIQFNNTNGSMVGSIQSSASGTSYNTSSDYRLKENAVSISDGITRLKTLKPYRFNFKAEPSKTVDGFFAHEVTAVPEAISGTKDAIVTQAMIDNGEAPKESKLNDPLYQEIDQAKIVPLLTAALQEAITKIETLETKVAALEGG